MKLLSNPSPLAVLAAVKDFVLKNKNVTFSPPHHSFANLLFPLFKNRVVVVGENHIIRDLSSHYDLFDPSFCVLSRPMGGGFLVGARGVAQGT